MSELLLECVHDVNGYKKGGLNGWLSKMESYGSKFKVLGCKK